jgi:ABC-type lipoprotein release transport system permease subunit
VIIVAIAFFFAAMWPAVNYMFTATFQNARYDLRINGPLTKQDIQLINQNLSSNAFELTGLNAGSVERVYVNGKTFYQNIINYYYQPSQVNRIVMTYFSDGLLLKGAMRKADAWGIDYMTAKRFGVGIGDKIAFDQSIGDRFGNIRKVHRAGIISAIYAPTNEVNGLVSPANPEVTKLLSADGVVFTDVFIKLSGNSPSQAAAMIRSIPKSREWLVDPVPEAYAKGAARVEQTLNRNVRYATIWAALLVYAIFILREQFSRMERRKKNLAILFSLGLSETRLVKMFTLEQILLNTLTGFLGIALGIYVLQGNLGLYIPNETSMSMSVFVAVIILGCLVLSIFQLKYRLRKMDVSRLLVVE